MQIKSGFQHYDGIPLFFILKLCVALYYLLLLLLLLLLNLQIHIDNSLDAVYMTTYSVPLVWNFERSVR